MAGIAALAATLLLLAALPLARAQAPGSLDALNANVTGGAVVATAVQPDGKTIIAGQFSSVLGVPRNNIARLNSDGSLDPGFNPNANSTVYCMAVQADGKILVGGDFTTLSATRRNNVARVNSNGSLDAGFDPDANGPVGSVAVQADGKILLGGFFTWLQPNGGGGTFCNYIGRVNADGSLDTAFNPNANGSVDSVVVQQDGKILLGGSFTSLQPNGAASTTTRNRIARVNTDGSLDMGFNPNANLGVGSVAVQADGKILLGGYFTSLQPNGAASMTTRNRIARVNTDGSLDMSFNPNANSGVSSVALQTDGKVLLGGGFTTLQPNGEASAIVRNNVARLNSDGSLDAGFDPNANNWVGSVAVQGDGKILLGGSFTTLQPNGMASAFPRNVFARLNNDPATQILSTPDATQVIWQRGGASPEV